MEKEPRPERDNDPTTLQRLGGALVLIGNHMGEIFNPAGNYIRRRQETDQAIEDFHHSTEGDCS